MPELLQAICERVPPPQGTPGDVLQAMVFDSHYDEFRGAITYVRIMNGRVTRGQRIRFLRGGTTHEVLEVGQFAPHKRPCHELQAGQVGYLICNIKSLDMVHVGDTVSIPGDGAAPVLPGYKTPQRMVYCGLYPSDGQDFTELREALEKLSINDPSFDFQPETSDALGFGFRCGFLGLLHMEIIQQRLEQEADIDLVQTAPNVTYQVTTKNGEQLEIHRPQEVPDAGDIEEFRQPVVRVNFILPTETIGTLMKLCQDRRGVHRATEYISPTRAMLRYELPLAEVIYDLHDKLKSATRGYGTMDYELVGYFPADLVRLDILVNGTRVDALSIICEKADADRRGRAVTKKLKSRNRPPHVRSRRAGGDRFSRDRARNRPGHAQERDRQMLRRRHHAETETVGEAAGRQETHEVDRPRRHPAESLHGRARYGQRQEMISEPRPTRTA